MKKKKVTVNIIPFFSTSDQHFIVIFLLIFIVTHIVHTNQQTHPSRVGTDVYCCKLNTSFTVCLF